VLVDCWASVAVARHLAGFTVRKLQKAGGQVSVSV